MRLGLRASRFQRGCLGWKLRRSRSTLSRWRGGVRAARRGSGDERDSWQRSHHYERLGATPSDPSASGLASRASASLHSKNGERGARSEDRAMSTSARQGHQEEEERAIRTGRRGSRERRGSASARRCPGAVRGLGARPGGSAWAETHKRGEIDWGHVALEMQELPWWCRACLV